MEMSADGRSIRRSGAPLVLFVGGAALLAAATAWALWTALPYEQLERYTAGERFMLWEGVVWLLALVLGFLGLSSVLQVVGWRIHEGVAQLKRHLNRPRSDAPVVTTAAVLTWGMIAYSLCLIIVAAFARSFFFAP